ncbi:MAG: methylglyoxal synthase [Pseudomonadota bacterium]
MDGEKRIALCAHDALKQTLGAWAFANEALLRPHQLTATANTGRVLMDQTRLQVECVRAGALGGDLELGALIAGGQIDILILLTDPLAPEAHDVDPAPLLRIAAIAQIAVATTEATADFIARSELFARPYRRGRPQPALPAVLQKLDRRSERA